MSDTKKVKSRKIKGFTTKEGNESETLSFLNEDMIKISGTKIKGRKVKNNIVLSTSNNEKMEISNFDSQEKEIKNENVKKRKVKTRKIKMSFTDKEEQEFDKQMELEDNFSIAAMIGILVLCFIVGISLGYILYKIAINSSNAMVIIRYFFK